MLPTDSHFQRQHAPPQRHGEHCTRESSTCCPCHVDRPMNQERTHRATGEDFVAHMERVAPLEVVARLDAQRHPV
jgi:hypothetical protein